MSKSLLDIFEFHNPPTIPVLVNENELIMLHAFRESAIHARTIRIMNDGTDMQTRMDAVKKLEEELQQLQRDGIPTLAMHQITNIVADETNGDAKGVGVQHNADVA